MTLTPIAVSPAQAAEMLGVSRDHLYRLLTSGEIRSGKSGARVLVEVESIKDYIESIRRDAS
jgi:excisionase family DNA binding protein